MADQPSFSLRRWQKWFAIHVCNVHDLRASLGDIVDPAHQSITLGTPASLYRARIVLCSDSIARKFECAGRADRARVPQALLQTVRRLGARVRHPRERGEHRIASLRRYAARS